MVGGGSVEHAEEGPLERGRARVAVEDGEQGLGRGGVAGARRDGDGALAHGGQEAVERQLSVTRPRGRGLQTRHGEDRAW